MSISLKSVEAKILSMLKKEFPEITFYDNSVVENMKRPCMFLQWRPVDMGPHNYWSRNNKVAMYITYHQLVKDDSDTLDKIQRIRDLFGLYIKVDDRAVDVGDIDVDYIGAQRNIPQINVDFCWYDKIDHTPTAPLMEHIESDLKLSISTKEDK